MKRFALFLALATILTLNAILFTVLATGGLVVGHDFTFAVLVDTMYVALTASSVLLGRICWREKKVFWAAAFFLNIFMVAVPTMLKVGGLVNLNPDFLFGLDMYWLNLHLFYLGSTDHTALFHRQ